MLTPAEKHFPQLMLFSDELSEFFYLVPIIVCVLFWLLGPTLK